MCCSKRIMLSFLLKSHLSKLALCAEKNIFQIKLKLSCFFKSYGHLFNLLHLARRQGIEMKKMARNISFVYTIVIYSSRIHYDFSEFYIVDTHVSRLNTVTRRTCYLTKYLEQMWCCFWMVPWYHIHRNTCICILILLYLSTECVRMITNNNETQSTTIATIIAAGIHSTTNTTVTTAGIVTSSSVSMTTPTAVQQQKSSQSSAGTYVHSYVMQKHLQCKKTRPSKVESYPEVNAQRNRWQQDLISQCGQGSTYWIHKYYTDTL